MVYKHFSGSVDSRSFFRSIYTGEHKKGVIIELVEYLFLRYCLRSVQDEFTSQQLASLNTLYLLIKQYHLQEYVSNGLISLQLPIPDNLASLPLFKFRATIQEILQTHYYRMTPRLIMRLQSES